MRPRGQAPASGRFTDLVPALLILQQAIHPPTIVGEVGSKEGGAPRPHRHHKNHFDRARQGPSPSLGVPFAFFFLYVSLSLPQKDAQKPSEPQGVSRACPSFESGLVLTTYPAVSEPRRPEDVHLGMSLLQDSPQTHAAARLLHSVVPRPRLEGWWPHNSAIRSLVKWCFSKAPAHFSRVRKSTRKTSRAWPWPATVELWSIGLWWYHVVPIPQSSTRLDLGLHWPFRPPLQHGLRLSIWPTLSDTVRHNLPRTMYFPNPLGRCPWQRCWKQSVHAFSGVNVPRCLIQTWCVPQYYQPHTEFSHGTPKILCWKKIFLNFLQFPTFSKCHAPAPQSLPNLSLRKT